MNEEKAILLRIEAKLDALLAALSDEDPEAGPVTALTGEKFGAERDDTQPL